MKNTSETMLCLCLLFAQTGTAQKTAPTFTTFDVPGAGASANQGTFPVGIDEDENVTGYFADANGVYHGFVRASTGTIAAFDAPGVGMGAGQYDSPNHQHKWGYRGLL
jgi:hypothetical protein